MIKDGKEEDWERKTRKKRYQRIGKEEIKLSVFTDYMFLYMEARLVFN